MSDHLQVPAVSFWPNGSAPSHGRQKVKGHVLRVLQIWQMKQEEVHAVAHKLLAADRVIHEQQLGWQWRGPDEDALLAGPHNPQASRTLAGSKKKSISQKASSEIADNEEMPDGQSLNMS